MGYFKIPVSWLSKPVTSDDGRAAPIGLLTESQFNTYKKYLKEFKGAGSAWWLKMPSINTTGGQEPFTRKCPIVCYDKLNSCDKVDKFGSVVNAHLRVRPYLQLITYNDTVHLIDNPPQYPTGVHIGDLVTFGNINWVVCGSKFLICDDYIGLSPYRDDWQSPDAQLYSASTVLGFMYDYIEHYGYTGKLRKA